MVKKDGRTRGGSRGSEGRSARDGVANQDWRTLRQHACVFAQLAPARLRTVAEARRRPKRVDRRGPKPGGSWYGHTYACTHVFLGFCGLLIVITYVRARVSGRLPTLPDPAYAMAGLPPIGGVPPAGGGRGALMRAGARGPLLDGATLPRAEAGRSRSRPVEGEGAVLRHGPLRVYLPGRVFAREAGRHFGRAPRRAEAGGAEPEGMTCAEAGGAEGAAEALDAEACGPALHAEGSEASVPMSSSHESHCGILGACKSSRDDCISKMKVSQCVSPSAPCCGLPSRAESPEGTFAEADGISAMMLSSSVMSSAVSSARALAAA